MAVDVDGVIVGGGHPIVVQSMTNTDTADADATAIQVARLAYAGSELVRITVNTEAAAAAVPEIVRKVRGLGAAVPIVGDFHYNGHKLLTDFPETARALDKYRINPGNVGPGRHHDDHFTAIVRIAVENGKPVRIGVNWGSLDQACPGRADGRQRASGGAARSPRSHGRRDGRERRSGRPSWPRRRDWVTTGSSFRPRCPACATWWRSTAGWPLAATTPSTWA